MLCYLSVCAGIEAFSVAVHDLEVNGERLVPLAFAEIDPFARAVLQARFPAVRLEGDFTLLRDQPWIVDADILVGGTPCQSFSIAGLRGGMSDDRGNLTLEFVRLADAIDALRLAAGRPPCILVWENVPGIYSHRDNPFGTFLAALVGGDAPIPPPRGRSWTNFGLVRGPKRSAAWRTLDAQFFGLAQRRERCFLVASAGNHCDPGAVLSERASVRGNPAPRREAGQAAARPIAGGSVGSGGHRLDADTADNLIAHPVRPAHESAAWRGDGSDNLVPLAFGGNNTAGPLDVATACNAHGGPNGRLDFESETFVAYTMSTQVGRATEDGTGRGSPLVVAHAFDARQSDVIQYGDRTGPLDTHGHTMAIAFSCKDSGRDASADISPTLRAMNEAAGNANAGGQVAIAVDTTQITSAANYSNPKAGDPCHPLAAGAHPPAVAFDLRGREGGAMPEGAHDTANIRAASGGASRSFIATSSLRRLTPRECERLQGFPDDWTLITYRGKPAADGPRYRALGNSMAVPCMRFLARRILEEITSKTPPRGGAGNGAAADSGRTTVPAHGAATVLSAGSGRDLLSSRGE